MIDENRFWELVRTWEYQTKYDSSAAIKLSHPAMMEIIRMGYDAIPLLLKVLPDNWFFAFALHKITGEWPVKKQYAGDGKKITEAWQNWAKRHKYRT